jgi:3-hydroxyisobutyrate dehydrogenase-like beta-hydroxyacid dehydrogenase
LTSICPGKSIVDCATLAEADMQRMSSAVVAKGGRFLEAPVSGLQAASGNRDADLSLCWKFRFV